MNEETRSVLNIIAGITLISVLISRIALFYALDALIGGAFYWYWRLEPYHVNMYAFLGAWGIFNILLSVVLLVILNHHFMTDASEKRAYLCYGIILLFHPILLSIMGVVLIFLSQHDEAVKIKENEEMK